MEILLSPRTRGARDIKRDVKIYLVSKNSQFFDHYSVPSLFPFILSRRVSIYRDTWLQMIEGYLTRDKVP